MDHAPSMLSSSTLVCGCVPQRELPQHLLSRPGLIAVEQSMDQGPCHDGGRQRSRKRRCCSSVSSMDGLHASRVGERQEAQSFVSEALQRNLPANRRGHRGGATLTWMLLPLHSATSRAFSLMWFKAPSCDNGVSSKREAVPALEITGSRMRARKARCSSFNTPLSSKSVDGAAQSIFVSDVEGQSLLDISPELAARMWLDWRKVAAPPSVSSLL